MHKYEEVEVHRRGDKGGRNNVGNKKWSHESFI